jgi:hypothetical protein
LLLFLVHRVSLLIDSIYCVLLMNFQVYIAIGKQKKYFTGNNFNSSVFIQPTMIVHKPFKMLYLNVKTMFYITSEMQVFRLLKLFFVFIDRFSKRCCNFQLLSNHTVHFNSAFFNLLFLDNSKANFFEKNY